jgi:hypothetical protein
MKADSLLAKWTIRTTELVYLKRNSTNENCLQHMVILTVHFVYRHKKKARDRTQELQSEASGRSLQRLPLNKRATS